MATSPVTLTPSSTSVEFGADFTVKLSATNSDFKHELNWQISSGSSGSGGSSSGGSTGNAQIINGKSGTVTFNVPKERATTIPSATSAKITITCKTTLSGNYIGTYTTYVTATLPSNVIPTISSIQVTDPTGCYSKYGGYVKSKSKLSVFINASGAYGSTITSYKTTLNDNTYTGNNITTDFINFSGTKSIGNYVTDSRGRKSVAHYQNVSVLDYSNPTPSVFKAYRCDSDGTKNDEGAYIKAIYNGSITALNNKNGKSFQVQYKLQSATTWTTLYSYTSGYSVNGNSIFSADINSAYDLRFILIDDFITVTKSIVVSTAYTLIDFNASGKGIAFGKVSEVDDGMEVNMDMHLLKQIIIDGMLKVMNTNVFYTKGDTISLPNSVQYAGCITTSNTELIFTIPLAKPIVGATSATATFTGLYARGINGYIMSNVSNSTFSSVTTAIANGGNHIRITCKAKTAISGVTNNSPCVVMCNVSIKLS